MFGRIERQMHTYNDSIIFLIIGIRDGGEMLKILDKADIKNSQIVSDFGKKSIYQFHKYDFTVACLECKGAS